MLGFFHQNYSLQIQMTFSRHFNHPYNFVYTQGAGIIGDNDLRIHVLSFQVESKGLKFVRELLDFCRLKKADKLTVQGLIEICDLERKRSKDRDFRLAILVNKPLVAQIAQVYAQVISTANLKVEVIHDDVDEALTWLGYDDKTKGKLKRFIGQSWKNANTGLRPSEFSTPGL